MFNKLLNVWNPDLNHEILYMNCYYLYSLYKDYFQIAKAKSHKYVFFIA